MSTNFCVYRFSLLSRKLNWPRFILRFEIEDTSSNIWNWRFETSCIHISFNVRVKWWKTHLFSNDKSRKMSTMKISNGYWYNDKIRINCWINMFMCGFNSSLLISFFFVFESVIPFNIYKNHNINCVHPKFSLVKITFFCMVSFSHATQTKLAIEHRKSNTKNRNS